MNDLKKDLKNAVLDAIKKEGVRMRPRWHFLLLAALMATGVLILLLALVYLTSFIVFLLYDGGSWFAPSFGMRGWFDLLRSIPIYLLILLAIFTGVLDTLVRRYSFAYRRPLLASLGAIVLIVFVSGFIVAQTSFHHSLAYEARQGRLPPPFGAWYGHHQHPHPEDMYRGSIVSTSSNGFIIKLDDESTTTVVLTPHTRLPFGADFAPGDMLVVIGDAMGTGTIRAFGILEIDPGE